MVLQPAQKVLDALSFERIFWPDEVVTISRRDSFPERQAQQAAFQGIKREMQVGDSDAVPVHRGDTSLFKGIKHHAAAHIEPRKQSCSSQPAPPVTSVR